ncbi:hypothetical protein V1478_003746 [Vespula squamosa]|uniref:Uncharacterized protein n=1 Tax=Vespula squamosa TaxID=30214 RepID=A0ABD2BMN9_VESSQ
MAWCGAVRCGAVRCGEVRCGAVRCGAVWRGVAWHGTGRRALVLPPSRHYGELSIGKGKSLSEVVIVVAVMVVVVMVMWPTPPPISEKLWYLAGGARKLPRHDEEGNIVGARARKPRGTHRINFHPFGEINSKVRILVNSKDNLGKVGRYSLVSWNEGDKSGIDIGNTFTIFDVKSVEQ